MNKELARTLTLALVNYIDENRPEGTMDCSTGECVSLEKAFTDENFDSVETLIKKKLSRLTEFELSLRQIIEVTLSDEVPNGSGGTMSWAVALSDDDIKKLAPKVLALAKKELARLDEVITLGNLGPYDKGFQDGKAEAMADLEKTYFSNPDKLPKWLKDDIARKELNAHTKGYNKGYKDAEKRYNESVAYHYPTMPQRPLCWEPGGTCTNPQMDCINCPRRTTGGGFSTSSGTSTSTLHGNTSATDGKEHNPSFTD